MKKSLYIVLALVVLLAIVLIWNNGQTELNKTIGVIIPLSGPAGNVGEAVKWGLDLVPVKNITLEYQDDECDSKKAISAYNSLKLKGIKVYYAACSGSVLALAPLIKADGNLLVTSFAGSSEIRKTGTEVIRFIPDALSIVSEMKKYIANAPFKNYGLLYEEQDYSKSVADSIIEALRAKLVVSERYSGKDISFKTQLLKFKGKVDAIVLVPVSDKAEQILLKEMKTLGIKAFIIGEVNVCDYEFKPSHVGLSGVCWKSKLSDDKQKKFDAFYQAKYGKPSQYPFYDAVSYDLISVLDELMAENKNTAEITKEILNGVSGPISSYQFDKDGEVVADEYLERFELIP